MYRLSNGYIHLMLENIWHAVQRWAHDPETVQITTHSLYVPMKVKVYQLNNLLNIQRNIYPISQEYPPLNTHTLPACVQSKLQCVDTPPVVTEYDTYRRSMAVKEPRSGVPNDLQKTINYKRVCTRVGTTRQQIY